MADTRRSWETIKVIFLSTTVPKLVTRLYGGESITIKMTDASNQTVYIGPDKGVTTKTGYKLDKDNVMSISLDESFGVNNYIEIWALPEGTNDVLNYFKIVGGSPRTGGT